MSGFSLRKPSIRRYEIDGKIYSAKRLPRSPHDWAVMDEDGMFCFLVHYLPRPKNRYYLHGRKTQAHGLGDAIAKAFRPERGKYHKEV